MFEYHRPVSAYLVAPTHSPRRLPAWKDIWAKVAEVRRYNPKLFRRSFVALAIWCGVVGFFQGLTGLAPSQAGARWQAPTGVASQTSTAKPVKAAPVAQAVAAQVLPAGPNGQLLPPGTMAADRTFRNTYAWGQCTWYVAGRRQIPSNWGNARTWYANAAAAKWSVGTVPAIAAIAWTPAGYYGHVALVEQVSPDGKQVYVSEMNYRGLGIKSYRWTAASDFKYIY
jgi:surface antigen